MKQKLTLLFICLLSIWQIKAQTGTTCATAKAFSESNMCFNSEKITQSTFWYSFVATDSTMAAYVYNTRDTSYAQVIKTQLFGGTCTELYEIARDSINTLTDSIPLWNAGYSLIIGNTYYLKITKATTAQYVVQNQDTVYCQVCLKTLQACPFTADPCNMVCNSSFEVGPTINSIGFAGISGYHSEISKLSCWNYSAINASCYPIGSATSNVPVVFDINSVATPIGCTAPPAYPGNGIPNSSFQCHTEAERTGRCRYVLLQERTEMTGTINGSFYPFINYKFGFYYNLPELNSGSLNASSNPVFANLFMAGNLCTNANIFPTTNFSNPANTSGWTQRTNTFSLSAAQCAQGFNRLEIANTALSGANPLGVFFDDITLNAYSANAGPNKTFCSQTTTLGVTYTATPVGAFSYTWTSSPTDPTLSGQQNNPNPVVTPTVTTVYTLTITDKVLNCPILPGTVTITIVPPTSPTIIIAATSRTICPGQTTTLTATGATTYTWAPSTVSNTIAVSPTITTTYTVSGTNNCGLTTTTTVVIYINTTPTITVNSETICSGNPVVLTANGATTYTWQPVNLNGSSITVTPAVTTNYTVSGTCGNIGSAVSTVSVIPSPTYTVSSTNICAGSSVLVTPSGSANILGLNFQYPAPFSPSNLATNPHTYNTAGNYTIEISIENYPSGTCYNTQYIPVTVTAQQAFAITYTSLPCSYNYTFTESFGCNSNLYTYDFSVNGTPSTSNSTGVFPYTFPSSGTYTISGYSSYDYIPVTFTINVPPATPPTVSISASPSQTICSGSTVTLTASGASTYIWSPGGTTGSTLAVTPFSTTTYTATGTNSLGCTATKTITVVVNALPSLTVTASSATICSGKTTTLTASGATSYTWNPGPLTGAVVTVTPTSSTIYTVTGNNGSCSNTKTISITVNPSPTITATATGTICSGSGSSATLTAGGGTTTYTWSPGTFTTNPAIVNPSVTTTYTVTGSNGTCTNTKTVTVNITPLPTVTVSASSTTICIGSSTTLTATGATTYSWNPGALSGSTVNVSPTVNTIYTVTGYSNTCTNTKTISITVVAQPTVVATASPTVICAGSTVTLSATGATSYTWNPGVLTTNPVTVTPTSTTIYTVTGKNTGCSRTATVNVIVNPVPSLTLSPLVFGICPGQSITVNATGASTYSWSTGVTTSSIVMSPTVSTNYTVTGTGSNGCTTRQTYSLTVYSIPAITTTASPNSICAGSSSTLSMSAGGNFNTWSTGGFGNTVVVTPSVTTTYTAYTLHTGTGCANSTVVTVSVSPISSLSANPSTICAVGQTATLTAGGATTYTWSNGANTATTTVTPSVTTTYTVRGSGPGCPTSTLTITVSVNTTPTITASASPTTMCVGNTATLTASGATTYTWSSGAQTASTTVVPGAVSIYTVTGTTNGCSATNTVQIALTPQYCCQSSSFTIGTSTTSSINYYNNSNGSGAVIDMQGTITFTANSTMSNYIIRMAPGSSMWINPNVTVTFSNCTIYSCSELWFGIVVADPGIGDAGNLNVINTTVEDMYYGIMMLGNGFVNSSSPNGNVTITDSRLNKNHISVLMSQFPKYTNGVARYGLTVTGTTISSVYSPTSPQSTLKTSTTYTSYAYNNINNVSVPYTNFPRGYVGIALVDLNETPVIIGDSTGTGGTNRFENLDFGISGSNATIYANNNHFVNITGSQKQVTSFGFPPPPPPSGPDEIGIAIAGIITVTNTIYTSRIGAASSSSAPVGGNPFPKGNKFEDCYKGVHLDFYRYSVVSGNFFTTNATSVLPLITPSPLYSYYQGQYGAWVKSSRISSNILKNYVLNHNTGIYNSHNILTSYLSNAFVKIEDNLVEAPSTTGYCKQAISVEQIASTTNLNTGMLTVKNNTVQNVYNGIKALNVKAGLQINSNPTISIQVAKQYGLTGTTQTQINGYARTGILAQGCVDAVIANNPNITGSGTIASGFYTAVKGIWMNASTGTSGQVNCNVISNVGRSMQFTNTSLNKVSKNVMNGAYQGLVLHSNGVIGAQGSTSLTNDNEWHGFTGGAAQYAETFTDGTNNANVLVGGSVLYVKPGSPYQPTQNYSNGSFPYITGPFDGIRVQSSGTAGESCLSLRLMGENNNGGMAMRTATDTDSSTTGVYEVLASDTTFYEVYQDETQYRNKQLVYELLNSQSIDTTQILQDFYRASQNSTYHDFTTVNTLMAGEDYSTAQSINSNINAASTIETYQKRINELVLKYLSYQPQAVVTNSLSVPVFSTVPVFDAYELADLTTIANNCLDQYGNVITQARVLLNTISNTVKDYEDNCMPEFNQRKGKPNTIASKSNEIVARVLPNPNSGSFILQYDLAKYSSADLIIYDVTGKLILKESITNADKQININMNKFENGIYYYTIRTNREILVTNKFVIIK